MKRYQHLAEALESSILSGALHAGDRLPSIRAASISRNVSPTTVFKAYYLLEAKGLIRARDRSGFYVVGPESTRPPEIEMTSAPDERVFNVDVSDRVLQVLGATMRRDLVPLGSALPSPELYPIPRLSQVMASTLPKLSVWHTVDDLSPGSAQLRHAISLRYHADGMQVYADDLVVTNGALEALNICLGVVTQPGDAVIVESPTFYAALQALERNHLRAIEVSTHPRDGIDLEAMERAIQRYKPAACWLMTNFQNPLGSLMPEDKKRDLVALLQRYALPMIEDDVYGELYFDSRRPLPAKAFDQEGLIMHCSSFSKSLAPGWRVGWVAGGRYTQHIMRDKLSLSLSASAPAQVALSAYLSRSGFDRHLRTLRHRFEWQRNCMLQAITAHFPEGTRTTYPAGGYFLWVELPKCVDTSRLHQMALAEGISIAPGSIFSSHERFHHCLRLNYGHPWDERLQTGMEILGRLIAQQLECGDHSTDEIQQGAIP
ncbi:GntR family transcriptional regulator [Chromohalobacter japonicus]|uniref:GntR family transcriptional regulator n=1 Tax=Chromohalobacter japonicus TaxID=223900 RepID=A0A1Q8THC4_9GAMM|nr:PLP-dependent aminotransferase family protein [Chromohalobacter japonicus]OLO13038.1 GntR family transcriptional regulator [Chromohalobacter japonicus]